MGSLGASCIFHHRIGGFGWGLAYTCTALHSGNGLDWTGLEVWWVVVMIDGWMDGVFPPGIEETLSRGREVSTWIAVVVVGSGSG